MYVRYVNDDHRSTRIIVLLDSPLSFIAITLPALRLCNDTWSRL